MAGPPSFGRPPAPDVELPDLMLNIVLEPRPASTL
jgi:hypothetical protein